MRRIHVFSNSNAIKAANRKHNLIAVMRPVTCKLIYDITVKYHFLPTQSRLHKLSLLWVGVLGINF